MSWTFLGNDAIDSATSTEVVSRNGEFILGSYYTPVPLAYPGVVVWGPGGATWLGLPGGYGSSYPGTFLEQGISEDGSIRLLRNTWEYNNFLPCYYRHTDLLGLQSLQSLGFALGLDEYPILCGNGSFVVSSGSALRFWDNGQLSVRTAPWPVEKIAGASFDARAVVGNTPSPTVPGTFLWTDQLGFVPLRAQLEAQGIVFPQAFEIDRVYDMSHDDLALYLELLDPQGAWQRCIAVLDSPIGLQLSTPYCTAGTSQQGCVASIASQGVPSAALASSFTIRVEGVPAQKSGLIFYALGQQISVWAMNSSSYLCLNPPLQRTGGQSSGGGLSGSCDGVLALDFDQWVQSHPGALGTPLSAGQVLYAQGWYRDPGAVTNTNLSNGLQITLIQ